MPRDYNKDYDNPEMTWDKYHKVLNDEGMSDEQIKQTLKGTKWDTQGKAYGKWRDGVPEFVQDTPEETKKYIDENPTSAMVPNDEPNVEATPVEQPEVVEAPVEEPTADELRKSLREQYSDDNDAYRAALASNNITPGNSTGKVRSIQQAYYDGKIDKGTRDYMMADTIAKFARNTGRDIGNIGAQYTGGTVNNNFEKPEWDKRNEELFKQQTSAEAATISNSDKAREATSQNLANEKSSHGLEASRLMSTYKNKASGMADKLRKEGNDAGAAIMEGVAGEYALLESGATSSVDKEEHIGNIAASLGQAVASGIITKGEMAEQLKTLYAGVGPDIDVNIGNPFAKEKTGNEALDAQTENDRNSNIINKGVSNDIRGEIVNFDKLDPSGKGKRVMQLYQQAGGNADKFKLAALVENDKIDPNEVYRSGLKSVTGAEIIDKVMKNFEDEKFLKDYKHYTNLEGNTGNTVPQRKQQIEEQKRERAYKAAAQAANTFGIDIDNPSDQDIAKLKAKARSNPTVQQVASSKDKANAIKVLEHLGIQY